MNYESTRILKMMQRAAGVEDDTTPGSTGTINNVFENPCSNHRSDPLQQNPMMNNVILKRLFELISPGAELNKARLVSRHWHKTALPVWLRNGATVNLIAVREPHINVNRVNNHFRNFLDQVHLNPPRSSSSATHQDEDFVIGTTGIKQYRKFHLEAESKHNVYPGQYFEIFWAECGAYLTHLTLKSFNPDTLTLKNILFCKHTPNLEYLVVDATSIESEEFLDPRLLRYGMSVVEHKKLHTLMVDVENPRFNLNRFPVQWKSLLNFFPTLKHFGFGRNMSRREVLKEELLMAMKEIRIEASTKLELKSFFWGFNQCFGCDQNERASTAVPPLPLLREAQLKNLETFSFSFEDGVLENEVLELLSIYAPTLKKLQVYKGAPFDPFPFPQMSQLRSLEMSGFPVKNLSFLKKLPNLRSLRLCDEYINSGNKMLSEFHCSYHIIWTANDFTRLAELMPNLGHLGMRLNNTNFPLVCQVLSQLEHLSVYGNHLGDHGIIGFGEINNENGQRVVYSQPNIARLSKLKSFSIESDRSLSDKFSQKSVDHGFLNLPLLEKLVIVAYINPEIKRVILERIPFAEVKTFSQYCPLCGPKKFVE